MKIVTENAQFMIVDDFLPAEQMEKVWLYFQTAPFINNDFRGLRGAWRLDDGRVMRAQDVYYSPIARELTRQMQDAVLPYPTSMGIDLVIRNFAEHGVKFSGLVGEEGKDWRTLVAAPRLYERNSSLYWHRDTPSVVTGSCTYYAHPEWNVQWGGELYIADASALDIPDGFGPSMRPPQDVMGLGRMQVSGHLDNREVNAMLMESGYGHYVMPKPNRLVVMKTGNPHMITKIQPAAGDHVRASVTMFLVRPGKEGAGGMM